MFNNVERLPRSYDESRNAWTPDWRNRQALKYHEAFLAETGWRAGETPSEEDVRALAGKQPFADWEDDEMVKARALRLAGLPMPGTSRQDFHYMEGWARPDAVIDFGAGLKGWLLAGLDDEAIGVRLPLSPIRVRVFHDVWFDVRGLLERKEILWRILCGTPLPDNASDREKRERRIIHAALTGGTEYVDRLLCPRNELSAEDHQWYVDDMDRMRTCQRSMAWS